MTDTLADLQAACIRELYNRTDLTTELAAAINSAISHYQKQKFWFSEETETAVTVANTSNLALPSDFGWVDGLTILNSAGTLPIRMGRIDWSVMQDYGANSTLSLGLPTEYAIYADQLWFYPTPDQAYALTLYTNFQNAPPTLGTDVSSWTSVGKAEELIRSRSVADIFCQVLKRPASLQEMGVMAQMNEPYLSVRERLAHQNLLGFTNQRISSGGIRPIAF